jgi:hypothetical protein
MSLLGGIGIVMISVETTIGETNASTTGTAIQDPGELSAMMTQAGEEIRNELASQGDKLGEQLASAISGIPIFFCRKYLRSNFTSKKGR